MKTQKINHAAVWVVAVLHQVVGALWYSPLLFSDLWVAQTGKTEADFADPSPVPFIVSFVGAVVLCYTVAWLFQKLQVQDARQGLLLAALFWVGFLFFEVLTFNAFELRPYGLAFINAGKSLVTFMLTGVVLGSWRKYGSVPETLLLRAMSR